MTGGILIFNPNPCITNIVNTAGGFAGSGINFDAKVRRNSPDAEDLFHAHIGEMDAFARALFVAYDVLLK